MELILDMVHHNPGEPPFETEFLDPAKLADYGYTGQVFKHINCVVTFAKLGDDFFPAGTEQRAWLDDFTKSIEAEIKQAKQEGLQVFCHIDLFVLPKALVDKYRDEICNPHTAEVTLDKEMTLAIHRVMIDEIFKRFPEVDGLIIRVGETYIYDTPYHVGNGAVIYSQPKPTQAEKDAFVKLIRFLREMVCERHDKYLIFRTWDTFNDRFHANPQYYLDVTDQIEPHEKLLFSIKHTTLDFWRRVKFNESLTLGKHPQIVEVQCQREYEGKGAYPNYVMDGVINGFTENFHPIGLRDIADHPLIKGVYTWSRGGGWYGPYIKSEFWPYLNTYVIAHWARDPSRSEEEIFDQSCRDKLNLNEADRKRFRELCLLSAEAVLRGVYCEASDIQYRELRIPGCGWMRDDRLGGAKRLRPIFKYLHENNLLWQALEEKALSVKLWDKISELFEQITFADDDLRSQIGTSIAYGRSLFNVIANAWRLLSAEYVNERNGERDIEELEEGLKIYDQAWADYLSIAKMPASASLYKGEYLSMPGEPRIPGLQDSIEYYRKMLQQ